MFHFVQHDNRGKINYLSKADCHSERSEESYLNSIQNNNL
jgi:hypothetical protein